MALLDGFQLATKETYLAAIAKYEEDDPLYLIVWIKGIMPERFLSLTTQQFRDYLSGAVDKYHRTLFEMEDDLFSQMVLVDRETSEIFYYTLIDQHVGGFGGKGAPSGERCITYTVDLAHRERDGKTKCSKIVANFEG